MEQNRHYFYAIKLPDEIKDRLQEACAEMKSRLSFKSWVHHQDYHITLAFLGNASKEKLQSSIGLVQKELRDRTSFPLMVNDLGVFGREDSPRIFWAGLEKEESLFTVRDLVYQGCQKAGFALETRAFHPHITLARKWLGEQPFSKEQLVRINDLQFDAFEVVLYETHLEKVPKYVVKETFLLER